VSAVQGQRVLGGFIVITGQDGIRYALRPEPGRCGLRPPMDARTRPFSLMRWAYDPGAVLWTVLTSQIQREFEGYGRTEFRVDAAG